MSVETRYQIILPAGDLQDSVLDLIKEVGYKRTYGYNRSIGGLPIDLVTDRASVVPERISDPEAENVIAGITGSDILWQNNLRGEGQVLPIDSGSNMYIGATPRLHQAIEGRDPELSDLRGVRVDTKFTKIAADVFADKGIDNVDIRYVAGKAEAQHLMYPNSKGIIDVWSSGRTAKENGITVVEFIPELQPVTVNLVEGMGLNTHQRRVVSKFGELLSAAAQRRNTRVPVSV